MDQRGQKKKVMGFGHRVYKHGDSLRAHDLQQAPPASGLEGTTTARRSGL
ncbi:citrate/2-methylcitrate synthase [Kocuria rhizophila]|nr:citrate/2-methylcitrate synthase [Kocuria rhizophila]